MSDKPKGKVGLSDSDANRLQYLIYQNMSLLQELTARYELRADLQEVTDRRFGAAKIIEAEIAGVKSELAKVQQLKGRLETELKQLADIKADVQNLSGLLQETYDDTNSVSLKQKLEEILNKEYVSNLESLTDEIEDFHDKVYGENEDGYSIQEEIKAFISDARQMQKLFFEQNEKYDGIPISKKDLIKKEFDLFDEKYQEWFKENIADDGEVAETKFDLLESKFTELERFYLKIFGTENKENKSLNEVLNQRLNDLAEVEAEAKKVINLASDAGLAGGFVEKANQARKSKKTAAIFFGIIIICAFVFNLCTINIENIDSITLTEITIRVVINIPLIWAATVANINLNKYSKLEQEYAHKESLAKSYERYKNEILKLSNEEDVNALREKLLHLNLDAFRKNPADAMDKMSSDSTIDKILDAKFSQKEVKANEKEG